jgi:3-hydroxyanthranilate 3,4-dioxygenase
MPRNGPTEPTDHANQPVMPPLHLARWIKANAKHLLPPVSNKQLFPESDDAVMFVSGGPNTRNDYHVNPTEELFYQLKGTIAVRIRPLDGSPPREVVIKEGELFLLPRWVPHRPQRPAGTLGLIIEFPRPVGQKDALRWYCPRCDHLVHEVHWRLKKIDEDLAVIMREFWGGPTDRRTCTMCGYLIEQAGAIKVKQGKGGVKVVAAKSAATKRTAPKRTPSARSAGSTRGTSKAVRGTRARGKARANAR